MPASPPRVIHLGLTVGGPLSHAAVLGTMAQRFGRFRDCYERGLERMPVLSGRVDLVLDVRPDGAAENIRIASSELSSPEVTSCLAAALGGLSFPAGDTPSVVSYPLIFVPGTSHDSGSTAEGSASAGSPPDAEQPSDARTRLAAGTSGRRRES
jgi:hypothetical protein